MRTQTTSPRRRTWIATASVAAVAALALASSAPPAAATPSSPGACHMILANAQGIAGMHEASDQGFVNMIDLVIESIEAGCSP